MEKVKKNFCISIVLVLLAIVFTLLVKNIDVKPIGPNGSSVGFAGINGPIHESVGESQTWYKISKYLGFAVLATVCVYGIVGLVQLIKRKSLAKVDRELLILAGFYVAVAVVYIFFEKVIINFRPILEDGVLEASYPSSHILIALCLCGSAVMINKRLFANKVPNYINTILLVIMVVLGIARFLSGVHWFTDIIGGIIISCALLMTFYSVLEMPSKSKK